MAGSLGFAGVTQAEVYEIEAEDFAGSFITSFLKYRVNEKTISTTSTGEIKKKGLGKFQSHTATEFNLGGGSCDTGNTDPYVFDQLFFVVRSNVVLTFESGQVFLKAVPLEEDAPAGGGCFYLIADPETQTLAEVPGRFDLVVKYKVVGGTGEFARATGELEATSRGTVLEYNNLGADGYNFFGGVSGTLEGSFCTNCP
ncbi:hypothetical protein [Microbulbifer sp. YPW1]|uniref:hypothetical protein n=1 Tax=Microbulbifer sp. YPW1 TaxID=2745199 RepID=UPI0015988548|nr:hypothetical protein [Microbulbifer sp. YPW1]QKX16243.1 hypothetical protein HUW35_04180 [Microbulbifer sp. YPW1]